MTNQIVLQLAKDLKKASAKNDAKIWSKIAEFALKPSIARRIINLNKIDKLTKEDDVVIHPGKILGTGNISHKITICSFSISIVAAKKIIDAGGKIINFNEMISKFPSGKGVTIIG